MKNSDIIRMVLHRAMGCIKIADDKIWPRTQDNAGDLLRHAYRALDGLKEMLDDPEAEVVFEQGRWHDNNGETHWLPLLSGEDEEILKQL